MARIAKMAAGADPGWLVFYDDNGRILEVSAYPHWDNGDGDWDYLIYQIPRAGSSLVVSDEDYPLLSFVSTDTLDLRTTYLDADPRNDYIAATLGVGDEFWAFMAVWPPPDPHPHFVVRRFSSMGVLVDEIPITGYAPANNALANVASWDGETFYLAEGQNNPKIWRWAPGSSAVLLGSIHVALQGAYVALGGSGECRQVAMHGSDQLLATTYNSELFSGLDHSAVVRFSLPDLTVIDRYEMGDGVRAGTIPVLPGPANHTVRLTFAITSDGESIWTSDFLNGEIWRVDPATGAIDLWNQDALDARSRRGVPFDPAHPEDSNQRASAMGAIALNARDFDGFVVPLARRPQWRAWPTLLGPLAAGAIDRQGFRFDPHLSQEPRGTRMLSGR